MEELYIYIGQSVVLLSIGIAISLIILACSYGGTIIDNNDIKINKETKEES